MCLLVYARVAADVQPVPWDDARPGFAAVPAESDVPDFGGAVLELGAHTGCACGFDRDADGDDAAVLASRRRLVEFLRSARRRGPVSLFFVPLGAGAEIVRRTLAVEALESAAFWDEVTGEARRSLVEVAT